MTMKFARIVEGLRFVELFKDSEGNLPFVQHIETRLIPYVVV